MTDRLYFTDGTHRDYLAVKEREVCLSCVTPNGDTEYWGYDEVTKVIANPDVRYGTEDVSEATDSPSQATESDASSGEGNGTSNGRQRLYSSMEAAGIDTELVDVVKHNTDRLFRITTDRDLDRTKGSPWREWNRSHFDASRDGDKPGYIEWDETDDGKPFPKAFCVPYDALEDVVG